jgi:hypothetical protein
MVTVRENTGGIIVNKATKELYGEYPNNATTGRFGVRVEKSSILPRLSLLHCAMLVCVLFQI